MESYDIQININVSANSEQEAEDKVTAVMRQEMDKPVLQRAINGWDFIEFISEDDPEIV
jgi:hypothetical protein